MTCVCNAHCAWETHWMNEWTLWHHTWLFGCGYARVRIFCAKWCQVKSQCLPQKKMWQVIHFAEVCMAIISFRSKSIPFFPKRVFSCCFSLQWRQNLAWNKDNKIRRRKHSSSETKQRKIRSETARQRATFKSFGMKNSVENLFVWFIILQWIRVNLYFPYNNSSNSNSSSSVQTLLLQRNL